MVPQVTPTLNKHIAYSSDNFIILRHKPCLSCGSLRSSQYMDKIKAVFEEAGKKVYTLEVRQSYTLPIHTHTHTIQDAIT